MLIRQSFFKRNFPILVVAALLFTLLSCQIDDPPTPTPILEEDVIKTLEGIILPDVGGLIAQLEATIIKAQIASSLGCDVAKDSTLNQVLDNRNSYNYNWKWENTCDLNENPFELTSTLKGNRRYLTDALSANEKIETSIYVSGFDASNEQYSINLTTNTEGSYRAGNDLFDGFVATTALIGININIDKVSIQVSSGTANFLFSGASISGGFFNFDGIITFNGGNTASIAFTNGGRYTLDW